MPLVVIAADPAEEAQHWYLTEYAPLSYSIRDTDPQEFRQFYFDGHREHPIAEESTTEGTNSEQAWADWYASVKTEGWLGGEVEWIDVEALNQNTVVIRTRWSNRTIEGPGLDSCDWYLAAKDGGKWRFTNYVHVICPGTQ
jgi:hypothetical protein